MMPIKKKSKAAKITAVLLALVLIIAAAGAVYLNDYYRADRDAVAAFTAGSTVQMHRLENGNLLWEPEQPSAGLIFYPGGKVEHTAYSPLMSELASRGVLCVLVEMPFRLAVLDADAAEGIREEFPQVENWYIGGHSLGGSMAASYLSGCADAFEGLILLGSYSTADLSRTELDVLSVYGSEDLVMNRENYEADKKNLPADYQELIIVGGCHAYFGMYGAQEGDGIPSITNEEQIILTADAVLGIINQNTAAEASLPPETEAAVQAGAAEETAAEEIHHSSETPYLQRILRADQSIFAGPSYDYGFVGTVEVSGTYTIEEESLDKEGNLWGKLKSGAGWIDLTEVRSWDPSQIPISANYADDRLLSGGNFELCTANSSEYAVQIAFRANWDLQDVSFSSLNFDGNDFLVLETLYYMPELTPARPFVAEVEFPGDMTTYGIDFTDSSGTLHRYLVSISGRNGSLDFFEHK